MADSNRFTLIDEETPETIGETPEPQPEEAQESNESEEGELSGGEALDDELSRLAVARALGLKDFSEMKKYQDQIMRLTDWARSEGATDLPSLVGKINSLRSDMGMGKDIYSLSVYAGMALEKLRLDQEMKEFKDNHG